MKIEVGEKRHHPGGGIWVADYVGKERVFTHRESPYEESSWRFGQWQEWERVDTFFGLGKKYTRDDTPTDYKCVGLYQNENGGEPLAVLNYHNRLTDKYGVMPEYLRWFHKYREVR